MIPITDRAASLTVQSSPRLPRINRAAIKYGVSAVFLTVAIMVAIYETDLNKFSKALKTVHPGYLAIAALAILVSALLAAMRVRAIAASYGYAMSVRDSVAVISLGQIGGLIFFQIFGQLIARSSYLGKRNIPFAGTVLITVHERLAAAAVSFAMAAVGALYIFKGFSFDLAAGGFELVHIAIGGALAVAAVACIWWSSIVNAARAITLNSIARLAQSGAFSLAVQLTMMVAYVAAGHSIAPERPLTDLAAASSLVMFAASIPVSFAGWGVRELSAVAALGAVGMTASESFIVAVAVGLLSILCAAALAASAVRPHRAARASRPVKSVIATPHQLVLENVLPVLCAMLVFFNVHVPTQGAALNVNLADPIAVLSGVIFLLSVRRSGAPSWRLSGLNVHILICSVAITVALLIGVYSIGWTQWAVTNKWLGWFVLLGYGAAGAMAARLDFEKVLQTFIAVGCVIICYQLVVTIFAVFGVGLVLALEGFAQNSNAFSFQCLMVLSASLVVKPFRSVAMTLALVGIWYTSSRAGLVSAAIILVLVAVIAPDTRRPIATALISSLGAVMAIAFLPPLTGAATAMSYTGYSTLTTTDRAASTTEHLSTMSTGLAMFLHHPIFGAGLGTFIDQSKGDYPLAIHSTPLWLLAEFGVVGAIAFVFPIVRMFFVEFPRRNEPAGLLIILVVTAFGAMSLLHELMYQRTFWFIMGAALAVPIANAVARAVPDEVRTAISERARITNSAT